MPPKDYIFNELSVFINKFDNVRVRYGYDEKAITHIVEIVPNDVYHLNEEYISWESEMFDKFIERYPMQNICFISDDALVGIENPEYVLYGKDFAVIPIKQELPAIDLDLVFQRGSTIFAEAPSAKLPLPQRQRSHLHI
ncbi:hypothetical protein Barb6_00328 [Bacteroidales bacterium Barb6]|nr:hypothetical protein Barb6_00328 [Bacteroidales bacterium Barb6]